MNSIYKKLLAYSYNIVGSYEDAKDLTQDVFQKFHTLDKSNIENETNFLIKSVINHSINFKNRISRNIQYGVWLPEPIATDNPETLLLSEGTASYTMLVLMEKLTATERAVFILKEGFDYSHEEIADILDITTENSRQLLSRAKKAIKTEKPKQDLHQKKSTIEKYINAIINADVDQLEKLLLEDIQVSADGGSHFKVTQYILGGKSTAIDTMIFVYKNYQTQLKYKIATINHQPALLFFENEKLVNCQIFDLTEDFTISNIYSVVDPHKLNNIKA